MKDQWAPISHYSDGALRRMAYSQRDLRSSAAARELARREAAESSSETADETEER